MSWPSRSTCPVAQPPSDSSCIRLRHRRNVLLPHPEGPMMAVTVWRGKGRLTSRTITFRLNSAERRRVSSCTRVSGAIPLAGGPAGRQREGEHEGHEDEGRGPRQTVPVLEGPGGVGEDLERERLHRL